MEKRQDEDKQKLDLKTVIESDFKIENFISDDMKERIEKKYGKVFFPFLIMLLPDKKQFVLFFHKDAESYEKQQAEISFNETFSNDEIYPFNKEKKKW
jgi:hypothetical protein